MKDLSVLVASDSFKGSLSSSEVADLIEEGIMRVAPSCRVTKRAIADGGEGTVNALVSATGGRFRSVEVSGPLGEPVLARYGFIGSDTAVIEMAESSGLTLIDRNEANALRASTLGVGQVILDAIDQGARRIYVGLGGSATSDGGVGMAKALGVRFLDGAGGPIDCGLAGLEQLESIDCSHIVNRISGVEFVALTDVSNTLCGPHGAVCVYGPQKGLSNKGLSCFDGWMRRYGQLLESIAGQDVAGLPGSGAAGGLGAALVAFCGARIERGIDSILDLIGLEDAMRNVSLVITGEGRMDSQSAFGKAPIGVARRAKCRGIPVIAVVGGRAEDIGDVYQEGIDLVIPISIEPMTLESCMSRADSLVPLAGESAIRALLMNSSG